MEPPPSAMETSETDAADGGPFLRAEPAAELLHQQFGHDHAFAQKLPTLTQRFARVLTTRRDGSCYYRVVFAQMLRAAFRATAGARAESAAADASTAFHVRTATRPGPPAYEALRARLEQCRAAATGHWGGIVVDPFFESLAAVAAQVLEVDDSDFPEEVTCVQPAWHAERAGSPAAWRAMPFDARVNLALHGLDDGAMACLRCFAAAHVLDTADADREAMARALGHTNLRAWVEGEVLPTNRESEELGVDALAHSLGVRVVVHYLDRSAGAGVAQHRFGPEKSDSTSNSADNGELHLLYRPGHYEGLCEEDFD